VKRSSPAFLGQEISKGKSAVLGFVGIIIVLAAWSAVSFAGIIKPVFLPTPWVVVQAGYRLFADFGLLSDLGVTLFRVVAGYLLAIAISVPFGIALAINNKFEAFFKSLISFFRYIPPSAFVPLLILWFGIGDLQKVLLIFLGVTTYITLMTYDVVSNTQKEYVEAGYTLGANSKDILLKIIVPYSSPGIWDTIRVNISSAWLFVIFAEIVSATAGLGYIIITSQRFLRTPNIFAVIIIIGLIGVVVDFAFNLGYKILFPWTEKSNVRN
jgi:NitT/TauT family transport system permease protein